MDIPPMLLKRLYTFGSIRNTDSGIGFSTKNRLSDVSLSGFTRIAINGKDVPISAIDLDLGDGNLLPATSITPANPFMFSLGRVLDVYCRSEQLAVGKHQIEIAFDAGIFGQLQFAVEDAIAEVVHDRVRIPRDDNDDYSPQAVEERQRFIEKLTEVKLKHVTSYSFDPKTVKGNCEHFVGVAQVPIGIAGPIRINGEHAQGDFLIPLATTEGTLVASYNRGMKVINQCGGVKCTVSRDIMQRAPVFVFKDARGAREFAKWVSKIKRTGNIEEFNDNYKGIKEAAEATSSVAKLIYIDTYLANKFAYLRFNYETGDAAGQNMVGRATYAACCWIMDNYKSEDHPIVNFYLESNFATDKKASQVNIMRTRGKRVTAEVIIKHEVLVQNMRVTPDQLARHAGVANVGAFMSGANNNGLHSANAITAMFIATGQDVANVSESSAGLIYLELIPRKKSEKEGEAPLNDLYLSITIPSLIIATHGGGVGLATQRECLEMLGCTGRGKVYKLAEIIAGVVLAGEISLGAAISSNDWVSSHEQYGRNR